MTGPASKVAWFWVATMVVACGWCVPAVSAGADRGSEPGGLSAFPGAQGGGAATIGGRGGRVIQVTNLDASGPGSLRAAVEAKGPRTVVFRVAGTIDLGPSALVISEPFITIAGQTAPGGDGAGDGALGGVCIKGMIKCSTHEVIIRYLRVRPGGRGGPKGDEPTMGFMLQQPGHCVVLDHCSFSWASDENLTFYSVDRPMHSVSVQRCIIAEGLAYNGPDRSNRHSAGLIVGSVRRPDLLTDFSIHHNLFAHNQFRSPYFKGASAEIISNIVYDWQWWATMVRAGAEVDVISNRYVAGKSFEPAGWTTRRGIRHARWQAASKGGDAGNFGLKGTPSLFIAGNVDDQQPDGSATDWKVNWAMVEGTDAVFEHPAPLDTGWRRERQRAVKVPVVVTPADELERTLLPTVGASRRLNERGEWVNMRDSADARVIAQFLGRTGTIPASPSDVGGYPVLADPAHPPVPYADHDSDGMPDAWERLQGLDPTDPNDGARCREPGGLTNLERFLAGPID